MDYEPGRTLSVSDWFDLAKLHVCQETRVRNIVYIDYAGVCICDTC